MRRYIRQTILGLHRVTFWLALVAGLGMLAAFILLAGKSDHIEPAPVLMQRFGLSPAQVADLQGGGEMWMKVDIWLTFRHMRPTPVKTDNLADCADIAAALAWFGKKRPNESLPAEGWLCEEKRNPNDPGLAGVQHLYHPASGLNLYREWR